MPRSVWLLVIGMAVNVTGSSFLWPLNAIFINQHLGKTLTIAGVVLLLNQAASVAGNLIGGSLFDKLGGYRTIIVGTLFALLASIGLSFWHSWVPYILFLILIGFGSGMIFPAMYALAGSVWKEGGRRAFNAIYVATNLGVALGSALGGMVASFSFELIFIANASLFFVYFLIALIGYRSIEGTKGMSTSVLTHSGKVKSYTKLTALLVVCFGYMLIWIGYVQWQTTIAAYTQEIAISLKQYSLLWTINGALIVLGQPLLSKVVKHFRTLKQQIIVGIFIFIIAFSVASVADAYIGFMTAMVIMTIGEMLIWPAVPTIAQSLAPEGREGFYQGIVNSTATVGRMLGPLVGGLLADQYGMNMLFITLSVLFVLSIFTTLLYDRGLKRVEVPQAKVSA
ncbi:MFS transporter [Bacillus carboniphilus]|uniref:MFS transporter n=1 Tax=Bacillus carboniphilus TaxID=86663 RepID=A0ABN0WCC1_9BACI